MRLILAIIITTIGIYLIDRFKALKWLYNTLNYPFKKRAITKLFDSMTPKDQRDFWLTSEMNMDESKWYYRSLEKYIRKKYIEPKINTDGSI